MKKVKLRSLGIFSRFFISFMAMLMFWGISVIILYQYAQTKLKEEIMHTGASSLTQLYNQYEEKLTGAHVVIQRIRNSSEVSEAITHDALYETLESYNTYRLRLLLTGMVSGDVEEIYIYFHNSDKIVPASKAVLSSRDYFETYYSARTQVAAESQIRYERWSAQIGPSLSSNEFVPLDTGRAYPAVAMRQFMSASSYKNMNATLVCVMNYGVLNEMLAMYSQSIQGAVMIFDQNGTVLAASDDAYKDAAPVAQAQGMYLTREIDGKEHMVYLMRSPKSGLQYMLAVPEHRFWEKLSGFRTLAAGLLTAFVLLGSALAWLLSRQNYKPVSALLDSVSSLTQTAFQRGAGNELDFIERQFSTAYKDRMRFDRELRNARLSECKRFLTMVLQNTYSRDVPLTEAFAEYGLDLLSENFIVMVFSLLDWNRSVLPGIYEGQQASQLETIVTCVLEELCGKAHRGHVLCMEQRTFVCVFNANSGVGETALEDAREICAISKLIFETEMGMRFAVACSELHAGYPGIRSCYLEAQRALEYQIVMEDTPVLMYGSLPDTPFEYNRSFQPAASTLLLGYVKTGQPEAAETVAALIELYFGGAPGGPEAVKSFVYDMDRLLTDTADALRIPAQSGIMPLSVQAGRGNFSALRALLQENLCVLARHYAQHAPQDGLVQRVMRFIEDNFNDSNLSVSTVGAYVNLTPSYCSKTFKNETGGSIGEYILKIRLEHACAMLTSSDDSVEDIASRCGFLSSSVFIRLFKKHRGVTPGAYRRIWRGAQ